MSAMSLDFSLSLYGIQRSIQWLGHQNTGSAVGFYRGEMNGEFRRYLYFLRLRYPGLRRAGPARRIEERFVLLQTKANNACEESSYTINLYLLEWQRNIWYATEDRRVEICEHAEAKSVASSGTQADLWPLHVNLWRSCDVSMSKYN